MKAIVSHKYGSPNVFRPKASKIQNLIEPLSDRELEVLGLIAAGMSNQEIAECLIMAMPRKYS